MAIAAAVGVTHQLFGPTSTTSIEQVEPPVDIESLRNVSPEPVEPDPFDDYDQPQNSRASELLGILGDWSEATSPVAPRAQAIIDRGETDIRILEASVSLCKYIQSGFLREQGVAACFDALDNHGTDIALLEDMVQRAKKSYETRAKGGAA